LKTTCNQSMSADMFFIAQIQTTDSAVSGGSMILDYIKVCNSNYTGPQCEAAASNDPNVIFWDEFAPTGP